jgi:hypothetical protein
MPYYAQIDQAGICVAVSQLAGAVETEHMVELNSYDTELLGKRWNRGAWEDVPQLDPGPEPEPTEPTEPVETIDQKLARLEEDNLILMDALATTFEEVLVLRTIVEGGTVS